MHCRSAPSTVPDLAHRLIKHVCSPSTGHFDMQLGLGTSWVALLRRYYPCCYGVILYVSLCSHTRTHRGRKRDIASLESNFSPQVLYYYTLGSMSEYLGTQPCPPLYHPPSSSFLSISRSCRSSALGRGEGGALWEVYIMCVGKCFGKPEEKALEMNLPHRTL